MQYFTRILCIIGQLAFTGPAIAQSINLGYSNGPFSLSLGTGQRTPRPASACEITIVPTGGTVRVRAGMEVENIACTDASCTQQQVTLCPANR